MPAMAAPASTLIVCWKELADRKALLAKLKNDRDVVTKALMSQ